MLKVIKIIDKALNMRNSNSYLCFSYCSFLTEKSLEYFDFVLFKKDLK